MIFFTQFNFICCLLFLYHQSSWCATPLLKIRKKKSECDFFFFWWYSEKKSALCCFQTNSTSILEIIFEEEYNFFTFPWREQCILITNRWNAARKIFNVRNTYLLTFTFHNLQVKLRQKIQVIASNAQCHLIRLLPSWFGSMLSNQYNQSILCM